MFVCAVKVCFTILLFNKRACLCVVLCARACVWYIHINTRIRTRNLACACACVGMYGCVCVCLNVRVCVSSCLHSRLLSLCILVISLCIYRSY